MNAITDRAAAVVIELLRSAGRGIKKCICLRRSVKLSKFRNLKSRFHRARSAFRRARIAFTPSGTVFLSGNLRSFRQFFCLEGEIEDMNIDLKLLEAQLKDIDGKLSREGRKPSEDVKIWMEEAEKIKKAAHDLKTNFWHGEKMIRQVDDDKSRMGKQNGFDGICPNIWHWFKMSLKVDEYKLRIQQLQIRHTKFEGKYGGDSIEILPRIAPALKAFEMSEETIHSINNWGNFCNSDEDYSSPVHPLDKTPLFCLAFFLQFFTESETTVTGLIVVSWLFVLTLFYVLSCQNKTSRELRISSAELQCSSAEELECTGDEIPQKMGSNCTSCSETMEGELGSRSRFGRKLDAESQQEIVPIED